MSDVETLINNILNGTTEDFEPSSRMEEYLKNIMNGTGVEGLPLPQSRLDALFYSLAEKMSGGSSGGGGGGETETVNKLAQLASGITTELTAKDLRGATKIIDFFAYYDTAIETITIPNTVKKIGRNAFQTSHLRNVHFEENSQLEEIDNSAFRYSWINSIKIPDSVTRIGEYAFWELHSFSSIEFGENSKLKTIGNSAFYTNIPMSNITIPATVTSIGSGALKIGTSSNKATIRMLPTTPPTIQSSTIGDNVEKIIVPKGCLEAYQTATNWSAKASIMEEATE